MEKKKKLTSKEYRFVIQALKNRKVEMNHSIKKGDMCKVQKINGKAKHISHLKKTMWFKPKKIEK